MCMCRLLQLHSPVRGINNGAAYFSGGALLDKRRLAPL
jgi:hypothetical protein